MFDEPPERPVETPEDEGLTPRFSSRKTRPLLAVSRSHAAGVRPDDSLSQAVIDEERGFEWFESKGHSHSPNPRISCCG